MKKYLFLILGFASLAGFAKPPQAATKGSYSHEELEKIHETGLVKLNGTKILHEVQVNGSLISQNTEIGSLDVMGEANLTETIVKEGGIVMGSFQATRSKVNKPLILLTHKAVISQCELKGITVKQNAGFKGKQILELRNRTLVDGPIHFESGKGEILLYSGSQVLGPVSGGKVIKK